jgi:hypothetical protein
MGSKPGFCSTGWFMKVWTKDVNLIYRQKPTKNLHLTATNQVYQHTNSRNSTKLVFRQVYVMFISGFGSFQTETVYRLYPNLHKPAGQAKTGFELLLAGFSLENHVVFSRFRASLEQVGGDKPVFQTESDSCNTL